MRGLSGCPDGSARCVGMRAAQRQASTAPLAGLIDGTTQRHGTRMKNAPSSGTRQRRQLRAVLGGVAPTPTRNHRKDELLAK